MLRPAIQSLLASLLLIGGSYARTYTITNNCPTAIDLFIGQESQGSLATGASVVKTDSDLSGFIYTTTRASPGQYGYLATARAGFFFEPNYWYYYIVRDPNPFLFNTGISITPDQPPSADGNFCNTASCLDGRCSTAFTFPPVYNGGPPPPDSIPNIPNFQCKVPQTNFAITFCPTGNWPVPQGARITPGGYHSQKCVDVRGNTQANGTPVQIYDCNNTGAQRWFIKPGSTKVQLENTNFCLDAGSNPANGVQMKIWQCYDNLPAQQWILRDDNHLQLAGTGLCLDLTDGDPTNGRVLQTWQCSDNNQNQWFATIS